MSANVDKVIRDIVYEYFRELDPYGQAEDDEIIKFFERGFNIELSVEELKELRDYACGR